MDHGCRVAHVEDEVLDLDHLGKDLPGIGCGNHDIGHDDDYAEILRRLYDHDLEGIVGLDDGETSEDAGRHVVCMETSGCGTLGLSGTEDDIGGRELLAGHHVC